MGLLPKYDCGQQMEKKKYTQPINRSKIGYFYNSQLVKTGEIKINGRLPDWHPGKDDKG